MVHPTNINQIKRLVQIVHAVCLCGGNFLKKNWSIDACSYSYRLNLGRCVIRWCSDIVLKNQPTAFLFWKFRTVHHVFSRWCIPQIILSLRSSRPLTIWGWECVLTVHSTLFGILSEWILLHYSRCCLLELGSMINMRLGSFHVSLVGVCCRFDWLNDYCTGLINA